MKTILLVLFATCLTACMTPPAKPKMGREIWIYPPGEKAKFVATYEECKDFAYRSVIAGSRYYESAIHLSCLNRKGYYTKIVTVEEALAINSIQEAAPAK